ncbi:MAG: S-methyl-5'-thioadenosine phosphorylase [Chloroflexi bacterium]|nr:S-methyl-5'-thioadenosine phosphorylase [Chloroflexota bacterium]MBP8054902.1 S-methyl-5'-thioadenosine phosphorylase [Chloroflexota bacterium]
MSQIELAIIGGSGLYNIPELQAVKEVRVRTPFGDPSDAIITGTLLGRKVAFLPRHGRGHGHSPSELPYRANIYALKTLGVKYVVAVSACGSLREDYAPGHVVMPDQLFDFTKGIRGRTFFGNGLVAHVGVAHPFSPEMNQAVSQAVRQAGGTVHEGGTFITVEGPRFSTIAESTLFRQWGMSIIGMTTSPEAFLALEAEMAYACMAHVTDYDVWHETEGPVSVEMVIRTLQRNTALAQRAIRYLVEKMDEWAGDFPAHQALKDAIITDRSKISPTILRDLQPLVGKYFP